MKELEEKNQNTEDNDVIVSKFNDVIAHLNAFNLSLEKGIDLIANAVNTPPQTAFSNEISSIIEAPIKTFSLAVEKFYTAIESLKLSGAPPSIDNSNSKSNASSTIDSGSKSNASFSFDNSLSIGEILGQNSKDSYLTALSFASLKNNIIDNIKKNVPKDFEFDNSLSIGEILGQNSKDSYLTALSFASLKNKIIKNIKSSLPKEFEFDKKLSVGEILGQNDKDSYFTALGFAGLKNKLIKNIKGALPEEFTFDTNLSIGDIFGELPQAGAFFKIKLSKLRNNILNIIRSSIKDSSSSDSNDQSSSVVNSLSSSSITPGNENESLTIDAVNKDEGDKQKDNDTTSSLIPPSKVLENILQIVKLGFEQNTYLLNELISFLKGDKLQNIEDRKDQSGIFENISDGISDISISEKNQANKQKKSSSLIDTVGKNISAFKTGVQKVKTIFKDPKGAIKSVFSRKKSSVDKPSPMSTMAGTKPSMIKPQKMKGGGGGLLGGIGDGIGKIGTGVAKLGRGFGKAIQQILIGLAKGLRALANPKFLISAAVLTALGAALFVSGKGFKQFGSINWKNVLIGIGVLGLLAMSAKLLAKAAPKMIIGGIGLIAISGAMFIAGKAFQQFADINWKNILIGVGVLGLLAAAAFGLSFIAVPILIGAAAIAVLGAALIPAAYAFKIFSDAITPLAEGFAIITDSLGTFVERVGETIANVVTSIADSIERLANINAANLFAVSAGIISLAGALAAFGAGSVVGSILGFFANDPVKDFERFAAIANPLNVAADAIVKLKDAINDFASTNIGLSAIGLQTFSKALAGLYSVTAEKGGVLGKAKAFWKGGGDRLKGLKDITELANNLNTAFSVELSDPPKIQIQPSAGASGSMAADINSGSLEKEYLTRNQQASAISTPIIANSSSGGAMTQNNNNVTYNKSNHIDSTMLQSVLSNAF